MILKKLHPQIYLFLGDSPQDLGKPFVRLQEFYESPSPKFRRRMFTLAEFQKWYCKKQTKNGKFSYYTDFNGYNVPGHVVNAFFTLYAESLTSDEMRLLKMIGNTPKDFYVIGSPASSSDTISHELSHAFFYLYPPYRDIMTRLHSGFDLDGVRKYLKSHMYAADMESDEITSYVLFEWPILKRAGVNVKHLAQLRDAMRGIFDSYKRQFIKL